MNKQEIINLIKGTEYATFTLPGLGETMIPTIELKPMVEVWEHQLTNGWIPVSERLPEESIDGITDDYVSYNVSLKFEYAECTRTYKFGQGKWWNDGTDMTEYVVAWQHLPEPYKEVSDAERN